MDDLKPFIENINKKIVLSPGNLEKLLTAFKMVKVSKKQFVIQPGFVTDILPCFTFFVITRIQKTDITIDDSRVKTSIYYGINNRLPKESSARVVKNTNNKTQAHISH